MVKRLTKEIISDSTGETDIELVESIEIIFGVVHEIDNLEECVNLRSLTMINTSLQRISNLACVGHSLERLCLCDQGLTRLEGLLLPNLRELLLHQNALTRIESLEGCPKLQKLWLFSNKISKIEDLHCCGDLREIWLQDNKISRIAGLDNLVNLQVLALAANRISDFKDLQKLSHMPGLRDLSLDDAHFGTCPIAQADGYWNFALCYLKQIRRLDGIEIEAHDRSQAEDAFMEQVLRFNDRVAAIQRDHQRELLAIETRQRRSASHADVMKQELLDAFQDLEMLVSDGRRGMAAEHKRQKRVRDDNLHVLEEALASLQHLHIKELDLQIEMETKRMEEEDWLYALLEIRAIAERDQALFISNLQRNSSTIACQHLSEHSPDLRFIESHFKSNQGKSTTDTADFPVYLIHAYRVYNSTVQIDFEEKMLQNSSIVETAGASNTPGTEVLCRPIEDYLYYCGTSEQFGDFFRRGGSANSIGFDASGTFQSFVLFSDPALAAALSHIAAKEDRDGHQNRVKKTGQPVSLVCCRISVPPPTHSIVGTKPSTHEECLQLAKQVPEGQIGHVTYGSGNHAGSFYVIPKTHPVPVLPQYHLLCASGNLGSDNAQKRLEELLQELMEPPSAATKQSTEMNSSNTRAAELLKQFEERSAEEVRKYEQRVSQEMDPETAAKMREMDEEARRLQEEMDALRTQIETEKAMQEQILRDFRHQIAAKGRHGKG